jgi:hypothetical protein
MQYNGIVNHDELVEPVTSHPSASSVPILEVRILVLSLAAYKAILFKQVTSNLQLRLVSVWSHSLDAVCISLATGTAIEAMVHKELIPTAPRGSKA